MASAHQSDQIDWKLLDYYYANLQAISRAQARYLTGLSTFLLIFWVALLSSERTGVSVPLLQTPVSKKILVFVAPPLIWYFIVGLMGSIRAMGQAWPRVQELITRLLPNGDPNKEIHLYWIDTHLNLLDYATFLKRWSKVHLYYPFVLLLALLSIALIPVNGVRYFRPDWQKIGLAFWCAVWVIASWRGTGSWIIHKLKEAFIAQADK